MASIDLILVSNPLCPSVDRQKKKVEITSETLLDIVESECQHHDQILVSVNGRVIARDSWNGIRLADRDCVVIMPVIYGGGDRDGKSILNAIAIIAAAWVMGPMGIAGSLASAMGFSATGFAAFAIYCATIVGGGILLSALTPSSSDFDKVDTSVSQTFSWSPHTAQQQGIVVPKYYGLNKVYGNIVNCYTEPGGTANEKELLNLSLALGAGPVGGIVSNQIFINDQLYTQYDGVQIEEKKGTSNQSVSALIPKTKAQYVVNRLCTHTGGAITYTVPDTDYDDLEVEILFDRGIYYGNDAGGLSNHTIGFKIEIRESGGTWNTLVADSLTKATSDALRYSYKASATYTGGSAVPIIRGTKYEVRLTKTTSDKSSIRYADRIKLYVVRESFKDAFTYPLISMLHIKALATSDLSGSFNVSCIQQGAIIQVYNGTVWTLEYNNNPAWVMYDILTQPVIRGDGSVENPYIVESYDGIHPANIDLAKFYELAQFCDDLVPDGEGGTEKRITFNGGFDTSMSVWEAAFKVCEIARCSLIWLGTTVSLAIDKEAAAVQCFSDGNIKAGSFKELFMPQQDRISELEMSYIDALQDYEKTVFSLVDDSIRTSTNKSTIDLFGVTKASEAWRAGMYRLAMNRLLTSTVEFEVDIDAIACTVGDVILVQSSIPDWGKGGRVRSATANTITIDRDYILESGSHKIYVRSYNTELDVEQIQERAISSVDEYGVITVATAWDIVPSKDDVYFIGEATVIGRKFRIVAISKTQDQYASITAIDYKPEIYDYDDENPSIPLDHYTSPVSNAQNIIKPITSDYFRQLYPSDVLFRDVVATVNSDIPLISGLTVGNNTPSSGAVTWSAFTLTYRGTAYSVVTGNSVNKYIYWDKNSAPTTLHGTDTLSSAIGSGKFVIGVNDAGTFYMTPGFLTLHGGLIQAGTVTADRINVANLAAISADLGNITAGSISADLIKAGKILADRIDANTINGIYYNQLYYIGNFLTYQDVYTTTSYETFEELFNGYTAGLKYNIDTSGGLATGSISARRLSTPTGMVTIKVTLMKGTNTVVKSWSKYIQTSDSNNVWYSMSFEYAFTNSTAADFWYKLEVKTYYSGTQVEINVSCGLHGTLGTSRPILK